MGGSREGFPETAGFSILTDPALPPAERRSRLDRLFELYWRPVYAFIRVSAGASIEDSKDFTQEFFQHVLESELVSRYDPKRGRFRHFLKGSLKNFLSKSRRHDAAEKRGGGATVFSLSDASAFSEALPAGASREEADGLFDRHWAQEVVAHSVSRLRETLAAEGKEAHFRIYEAFDLCPPGSERPSYEEIGRSFSLPVDQVRNFLHVARTKLQQLVVRTCAEYAGSPQEVADELRELFRR